MSDVAHLGLLPALAVTFSYRFYTGVVYLTPPALPTPVIMSLVRARFRVRVMVMAPMEKNITTDASGVGGVIGFTV